MIQLPLKRLKPGMVMTQGIYNGSGGSFLSKGVSLTESYIQKLHDLGIASVTVTSMDPRDRIAPPEDVLEEKTRVLAVKRVYDIFQQVAKKGTFDVEPLMKASSAIVKDILERRKNLVQLTDIRTHDMYTFAHSVNVAMLSALIAVLVGMKQEEISDLTLSTLMHDLGKLSVPIEILNKPSRLTDEEFAVIKRHPRAGFERIQSMKKLPNKDVLSIVALQHHEHMDGTGYPDRRKGKEIHIFGRISAIADVYDALTSSRPYKKAYIPSIAYNIMANCSKGQFDEELLGLFFQNVAIYPTGTVLKTSLGYGVVKNVVFGKTDRPDIILFADCDKKLFFSPQEVDLYRDRECVIEGVLKDMELYHFVHEIGFDPGALLELQKESEM
ncbi:HD-GYP domain-containing protein [Mitsuokella sp. oral taxon 131]|uniref:HD-GYP domain-containing protein n=1 Tax=Mitsuokella sp. oral taxon 131 TaxID=1321780 RepID=UPI0003AE7786|nr:HD-GYP domain-containing protein [Mitsuokella sp. oral taxon 131]ERL25504.1 HD domain protein [Mitsuokella sp. oral taxon 131 str. W9106]